ncbi:MAG TPA: hypothetical protein VGV15_22225 [Terriglobales bacterium]|nr:hypothetical protein [Terriglobales bacterium]
MPLKAWGTMSRWSWAVLVFELLLITIILILPQVDIPDTAFHCGTAPVLAKARLTCPPAQSPASLGRRSITQMRVREIAFSPPGIEASSTGPALPILLHTLLC